MRLIGMHAVMNMPLFHSACVFEIVIDCKSVIRA